MNVVNIAKDLNPEGEGFLSCLLPLYHFNLVVCLSVYFVMCTIPYSEHRKCVIMGLTLKYIFLPFQRRKSKTLLLFRIAVML